ncbi:MAG: CinA family protein [Candidatus Limnocylindrales bacterium]|jgi:PncC family amidohydrolase
MAEEPLRVLVERLQELCLRLELTVATAESCTGGLVASAITDVSGSSGYFRGGVVAYSNEAKIGLLGVPAELLEAHGAVSAQVARAMALGVRGRLSADLAVAVTGVAGPGGDSASKPVGLTYVAVADAAGAEVRRFAWTGDRLANKESSARAALELLLLRASAGAGSAAGGVAE